MRKKKMLELHDLVDSYMQHGKSPNDIINVLGFELGTLFACSPQEESFETVFHQFVSNVYRGKKYWEESNVSS
jgi:hypothetical protein